MQRRTSALWLKDKREQKHISRKELARRIWPKATEATTARIKAYETVERDEDGRPTHVMLPSSNTLRAISEVLELPWPSTFTFAGYYHEILEALAALAELGKRWLQEDGVVIDRASELNFRSLGVRHFGEHSVWHALKNRAIETVISLGRLSSTFSGATKAKALRPAASRSLRKWAAPFNRMTSESTAFRMSCQSQWLSRSWPSRAAFHGAAMCERAV